MHTDKGETWIILGALETGLGNTKLGNTTKELKSGQSRQLVTNTAFSVTLSGLDDLARYSKSENEPKKSRKAESEKQDANREWACKTEVIWKKYLATISYRLGRSIRHSVVLKVLNKCVQLTYIIFYILKLKSDV